MSSLYDFVEYMNAHGNFFIIELMLCAQIAESNGWSSEFKLVGECFTADINIPELHIEHTQLLLREHGVEDEYIQRIFTDFCKLLPDDTTAG